jgi:hypothetical protein
MNGCRKYVKYTSGVFFIIKKNEIPSFAGKWMELQ